MKKILWGLALLFSSFAAYPAALPYTPAGNILCGAASGYVVACPAVTIPSGNSGGILGFTATNIISSSVALTLGNLVVGGGAGATPTPIGFNWQPSSSNTSTAFGTNAGQLCTACTNLIAFGTNAMANTTGNSNVGMGFNAGANISTGTNTLAIGSAALAGNSGTPTTGSSNTAIGFNALTNSIGTASNNTAFGQSAGSQNTTGTFNVFIGNAVGSNGVGTTSNVTILGTNNSCIPSSTSATNEANFCAQSSNYLRITNTNTPTTSKPVFQGNVTGASFGSSGTTFTLGTGTGACATTSTLTGGASTGSFLCTGTPGASTQIVTLPTAPNGNGWQCSASDVTSGVVWAQVTPVSTTSCKITGAIATASDVVVFHAFSY